MALQPVTIDLWDLQMDGEAPKKKWRFLQKYWHKGSFFQEASDNPHTDERTDNIFRRDYSNPTGEDKMDKTVLPKIMQVSVRVVFSTMVSIVFSAASFYGQAACPGFHVSMHIAACTEIVGFTEPGQMLYRDMSFVH